MATVQINGLRYDATLAGGTADHNWDGRSVRRITMERTYEEMLTLFPAGTKLEWCRIETVQKAVPQVDENGETVLDSEGSPVVDIVTTEREIDQSEWCLCGPIIDNRDGTYTVKMGKELDRELKAERDEAEAALAILMEGE